jgi:hypothetical protein
MASVPAVRFMLIFYVPPAAAQACKTAIFKVGAGQYPNYTECAFTTSGTGQYRPGDAASPFIGKVGTLEETPELRVETLCSSEKIAREAVAALRRCVVSFP